MSLQAFFSLFRRFQWWVTDMKQSMLTSHLIRGASNSKVIFVLLSCNKPTQKSYSNASVNINKLINKQINK